jgi:general secretion pathway protein C
MEALFKKQFWVVTLLFLAGNAFLLARASNQFVAYYVTRQMEVAPGADGAKKGALAPPKRNKSVLDLDERSNFFGAKVETVKEGLPPPPVEPAEKAVSDAAPVPTQLRIKLAGVTWFDVPAWSLASIADLGTNETSLYSVNPCPPLDADSGESKRRHPCNHLLADSTILEIHPQRVVFLNKAQGRREFIDMNEEANKGGPVSSPPLADASPQPSTGGDNVDNLGKGIVKVADNQYKIPQSDVEEVMANLNTVSTQARIVPSFEGGKATGFKLFSIRPNSVYNKIGLQNGDVVNRINGYEITSPDKALEVYTKLRDSKEITVDLTRRGQKVSVNYQVQ